MRATLDATIARQGGVFRREQALATGISEREFRSLTRSTGPWQRVRYGVYTLRALWDRLDGPGRAQLLDRAALLVLNEQTALSHSSAARVRGFPLYDVTDGLAHVTRLGHGLSNRIQAGIKHHRGDLGDDEIEVMRGQRVVSAARAVLGMTSEFGYLAGLVAADAALGSGLDRQALIDLSGRLEHHTGAAAMRAVAVDADGRAETPIETLARVLLTSMGIRDLELQYVVHLRNGRYAAVDIYAKGLRHVFETDGRLKYVDQVDRFGRPVKAEEVVWMEKKREDEVRSLGLGFSRLVWADVQPDAYPRTSARLWQEIYDQSAARRLPPSA